MLKISGTTFMTCASLPISDARASAFLPILVMRLCAYDRIMQDTTSTEFWRAFFPRALLRDQPKAPRRVISNQTPAPGAFDPDSIRSWIRDGCVEMSITPTEWARQAGLSPSTLNRFLKGNGPENLTGSSLFSLLKARAAHIEAAMRLFDDHSSGRGTPVFDVEVVAALHPGLLKSTPFEWQADRHFSVRVPLLTAWFDNDIIAFQITTDNLPEFRKESVVICSKYINIGNFSYDHTETVIFHEKVGTNKVRSSIGRIHVDTKSVSYLQDLSQPDEREEIDLHKFDKFGVGSERFISYYVISAIVPSPDLQARRYLRP